jgi:putative CocE/NonD family hydrolase
MQLLALFAISQTSLGAESDDDIIMQEAWIPMRDGVRLAADIYFPKGREPGAEHPGEALPVLLEYLPYRKTESRPSRYALFSYFIRHGYIVARVDIRGTGNSKGQLVEYEYSEQEQQDGEDIIAWLARQPYSSGKVGMFGLSWGGFNSIHMTLRNPPELKAVVAIMATDDLYEDDTHFIDGCMHVDSYAMKLDLDNALPGAPDFLIDEDYFRDRFDRPPWLHLYKHQARDGPFWDRTAPKAHYDKIRIPTFLIGGLLDGYRDSIPRMLEHVQAPVKAIMGPWAHDWPNSAYPEPSIEWRREAVRWFDHWLKGEDTGIMAEPRFAVFVRNWHPPLTNLETVPGQWRWEEGWPIERIRMRSLYPGADRSLGDAVPAGPVRTQTLDYVPTSGAAAGGPVMWWGDPTPDQRPSDAHALVYETEPLAEDLEILGFPRAHLNVSSSAPVANWFARLSDVAPGGAVSLVAGAGFNGTHRESSRHPTPLVPGAEVALDIEMHFTSWVFPAGHRIRLAVSNAQWPMFWPTPGMMSTKLRLGGREPTRLEVPVVAHAERPIPDFLPPAEDPELPGFGPLESGTSSGYGEITSIQHFPVTRSARVIAEGGDAYGYPWGTSHYTELITHETSDTHPEATSVTGEHSMTVELPGRTLRWEGSTRFESDKENFYYSYTRRLFQDGKLLREKSWEDTIPRDHQ